MPASPAFDISKIRYSTDPQTFQRAVELYVQGRIKDFRPLDNGYQATVHGTHHYNVFVSANHHDRGDCNCYVGQKEILCKHMVAVAIMALQNGRPLEESDAKPIEYPTSSGQVGELSEEQLAQTKSTISNAMRCIKAYQGPSRTWFTYQRSLQEGCNRLSDVVSGLPASEQTAKLIVALLLRLDRKLSTGGVDDSDGTIGNFIQDAVKVLKYNVYLEPSCKQALYRLTYRPTCFDWEVPLVELLNER